jgi:hypothetical protein
MPEGYSATGSSGEPQVTYSAQPKQLGAKEVTAQIPESLLYQGEPVAMCTNPLGEYFAMAGLNSPFESNCTALWRGYVGSWEIIDDRLYLIRLQGALKNGGDVTLEAVFPGFPDRVFAHWYSGTVRIPQGKQLEYVHMGYGSTFERDLLLEIERGVVVSTRVHENGVAESEDAPEGYGISAMTVFPRSKEGEGGAK